MDHICRCGTIMEKGSAVLMVKAFQLTLKEGGRIREREELGIVPKKTTCYTCPSCKNYVFYGYNYKYLKTKVVL